MNPNREAIRAQLCQLYAMEMAAREPGDAQAREVVRRAQAMSDIPMVLLYGSSVAGGAATEPDVLAPQFHFRRQHTPTQLEPRRLGD